MNQLRNILLILLMFVLASCNKEEPIIQNPNNNGIEGNDTEEQKPLTKDTIVYTAQVWVDKADMERYGGERVFKNNLQRLFRNTTRFWNESPNKFNYYFSFEAGEELHIYDIEGNKNNYNKFKDQAFGDLNTSRYDFVLYFALDADKGGLSCGGGGKSGHSVVMAYFEKGHNIFTDAEYPKQGTYSNLGHEYGHVRGAQDLYQYKISAENNRISREAYIPPGCNMGTAYMVWSDYCSALFNYTANQKQLEKNLQQKIFPEKLEVTVTKDGKPVRGVKVNFYGTRAGGYWGGPDVYDAEGNSPFLAKQTNSEGKVTITETYKMFFPGESAPKVPPKSPKDEFPFSRWYVFLVEFVDGNAKKYRWLTDLEMIAGHLESGNKTFELKIDMK